MRKRPLCFLCIALVVFHFVFLTSGGLKKSSDVFSFSNTFLFSNVTIYGEVYQCEYSEQQQILYLKQTVLSERIQTMDHAYKKLEQIKVTCASNDTEYKIGDKVVVYGRLKEMPAASNPGQFDSRAYYAGKKLYYSMWEPDVQLVERPKVCIARSLYDLRSTLSAVILRSITYGSVREEQHREWGNVLRGIVLGDKGDISDDTKTLYQTGGISHILAISAMHLTILGNGIYTFLKRCGVSCSVSGIIAGIFLTLYGILTGASTATIRALIMFLLTIGAQLTGRTYDGKTGLSMAAVLLLSGNPMSLTDSGFLLSFSAMISFALFRENRRLGSAVLLYIFMMPVTLWLFYEIPLYSVLLNLLVVPTLSILLLSGVFVCLLGSVNPLLGKLASIPGTALLYVYESICKIASHLPYARLVLGKPTIAGIAVYYGILLFALWAFRKMRLSWKRYFVYLWMLPAFWAISYHPQTGLSLTVLDVGQGDCIVVETQDTHAYMIDGGSSSVDGVGAYRIWPYLKHQGIQKLEAIFVTHPDTDHMNGILELLHMVVKREIYLEVKQMILPNWMDKTPFQEILHLARLAKIPVRWMKKGDFIEDGMLTLTCRYPENGDFKERTNEGSLVLEVKYQSFTGLLTGDLEGEGEKQLVTSADDIDYLKVAHHGSGNSTFDAFLQKTKPEISVISCGKNNLYGHPHEDLLARLTRFGSDFYATKDYGAIWVTTDGVTIDLHTFCKYNEF